MFFHRKLRADDAEQGEEEDEDRHLKADAEAENDGEEEAGVLLDGDHGVELVAEADDEDFERAGQDEEVAEGRAGEEQADGGGHEGNDEAPLFLVEAGRDEEPDLIEDEGRGEDGSADERDLQVEVQRVHGVGVVELDAELVERGLDEAVEALVEGVGDDEADGEIDGGVDDALAQLLEVLHQAHAGEFGALGDGLARFVDCVCGINHGGLPAPIFRLQELRLSVALPASLGGRVPAAAAARRDARLRLSRRWRAAECAAPVHGSAPAAGSARGESTSGGGCVAASGRLLRRRDRDRLSRRDTDFAVVAASGSGSRWRAAAARRLRGACFELRRRRGGSQRRAGAPLLPSCAGRLPRSGATPLPSGI